MEAISTVFRHWEDVVFENRNKMYGAYPLRRAYSSRVLSGLFVTMIVVAAVLSFQGKPDGGSKKGATPTFDSVLVVWDRQRVESILKPPLKEKVRPPKSTATQTTVLVTTDDVDEPIEPDEPSRVTGVDGDSSKWVDTGTVEGGGVGAVTASLLVAEPELLDIAEVMPSYEGGTEAMMKFIQRKIRYPRVPKEMGIEGTVYVRFVVNGDGSVSQVEILRGVHPDYDREAKRVISMLPAWKGGSHNRRPVAVRMVLPIKFNLQK